VLGFDCRTEGVFEHRPARPDRHECLVSGFRSARQQLVLTILGRSELEHSCQHVRRFLGEHSQTEAPEVVRLSKVRDPRTFPVLEQAVGVAVDDHRVALEHEHGASAPGEGERGGKPGEAGTDDHDVGSIPMHASDDLRLTERVQVRGTRPG
jgi:hypothetical protein